MRIGPTFCVSCDVIPSPSLRLVFALLATDRRLAAAYPAIAVVSLTLAGLFFVLSWLTH